jgi:hypothetical protein
MTRPNRGSAQRKKNKRREINKDHAKHAAPSKIVAWSPAPAQAKAAQPKPKFAPEKAKAKAQPRAKAPRKGSVAAPAHKAKPAGAKTIGRKGTR